MTMKKIAVAHVKGNHSKSHKNVCVLGNQCKIKKRQNAKEAPLKTTSTNPSKPPVRKSASTGE